MRQACELPEQADPSLGQWYCAEQVRQRVRDEIEASISPQTVKRILASNRLKPWRSRVWLQTPTWPDRSMSCEEPYDATTPRLLDSASSRPFVTATRRVTRAIRATPRGQTTADGAISPGG
jgi:hypothetical protein